MSRGIPAFVTVARANTSPNHDPTRADAELKQRRRDQVVTAPVSGDTVTCGELSDRADACWRDYYQTWPPRNGVPAPGTHERERADAQRVLCRRRSQVVLQVCGLPARGGNGRFR